MSGVEVQATKYTSALNKGRSVVADLIAEPPTRGIDPGGKGRISFALECERERPRVGDAGSFLYGFYGRE
jgi:hypothetical protein